MRDVSYIQIDRPAWKDYVLEEIRWVQGLRRPGDGKKFSTDWREVLFARLSLDFDRLEELKGSPKTIDSENGLGFVPCAYYYIHRCEPDFSDSTTSFCGDAPNGALVAPFDTGGLWQGHYPGCGRMVGDEKRRLVERYSFEGGQYISIFQAWGRKNFDSSGDYTKGVVPHSGPYVKNLKNEGWRDVRRLWMWEARVPLSDSPNGIRPVRLFMREIRFREYLDWILSTPLLGTSRKVTHVDLVTQIHEDCGDINAGEAMNKELTGVSAW